MKVRVLGKNWFACCVHCKHGGEQVGHEDPCEKGCDALTGVARVR